MSHITDAECHAGISRQALAAMNAHHPNPGTNGKNGKATELQPPQTQAPRAPEKVCVVDSYNRTIDLLDVNGWNFVIRETQHFFGDNRATAINLWLTRIELETLRNKIDLALRDEQ